MAADTSNNVPSGGLGQTRWTISVSPPPRASGIASMLVALGGARIAVTHVEPAPDDTGVYVLQLDGPPGAVEILTGIGCAVHGFASVRNPAPLAIVESNA